MRSIAIGAVVGRIVNSGMQEIVVPDVHLAIGGQPTHAGSAGTLVSLLLRPPMAAAFSA